MTQISVSPGLQIDDDQHFHKRNWTAQRIGRLAMYTVVAAALLGVFGGGPLSGAIAGKRGGTLWIEYDRFARLSRSQELRVNLGSGAAGRGEREATLWVSRSFLNQIENVTLTPSPDRSEAGPDRVTYVFAVSDDSPTVITLHYLPARFGRLSSEVGLVGGESVRFSSLVYP